MTREKTFGIKLHIGVDVPGLPHTIMMTTADVTDRRGAIDMIGYYCNAANPLSLLKTVPADE